MLRWIKPDCFIPVHGTLHHLKAHAELAQSLGVNDTCVVENGAVVSITAEKRLSEIDEVKTGRVFVGAGRLELDARTRRRRVELGRKGVVVLSAPIGERGECQGPVQVSSLGVPRLDSDERLKAALASQIKKCWPTRSGRQHLEENLRGLLRRLVQESVSVRPQVQVHLLDISSPSI